MTGPAAHRHADASAIDNVVHYRRRGGEADDASALYRRRPGATITSH